MRCRQQLEAAYRATDYRVETPDSSFAIRVGQPCPELDRLLAHHQVKEWAYLTAWNPSSILCDIAENERQQQRLIELLTGVAPVCYPGRGVGGGEDWPAEPSVLVLGIDEPAALAIGRRFGQAAIVVGRRGEAARLAWCD